MSVHAAQRYYNPWHQLEYQGQIHRSSVLLDSPTGSGVQDRCRPHGPPASPGFGYPEPLQPDPHTQHGGRLRHPGENPRKYWSVRADSFFTAGRRIYRHTASASPLYREGIDHGFDLYPERGGGQPYRPFPAGTTRKNQSQCPDSVTLSVSVKRLERKDKGAETDAAPEESAGIFDDDGQSKPDPTRILLCCIRINSFRAVSAHIPAYRVSISQSLAF